MSEQRQLHQLAGRFFCACPSGTVSRKQLFRHGQEELPALSGGHVPGSRRADAVQDLPRHLRPSGNHLRFGRSIGYQWQGTLPGWEILTAKRRPLPAGRRIVCLSLFSSRMDGQDGPGHLVGRVLREVPHWCPVDFAVSTTPPVSRARKELAGPKATKCPVNNVRPVSRRFGPAPPPRRYVWSPRQDLLFPRKTLAASSAQLGPTSPTSRRAAAGLARQIPGRRHSQVGMLQYLQSGQEITRRSPPPTPTASLWPAQTDANASPPSRSSHPTVPPTLSV